MSHVETPLPTITPNNVISSPNLRRTLGVSLYVVSILTGAAVFILSGIELPVDVDFWATRILGGIAIISGGFGLGVTTPNIPR